MLDTLAVFKLHVHLCRNVSRIIFFLFLFWYCSDLGNSNLSGHLVPELGKLEHLQYLYVYFFLDSMLTWFIVTSEMITYLIFNGICLLLWLPWVSVASDLFISGHPLINWDHFFLCWYRELYKNHIEGTIPSELGNLKSLISLDLYNNNISGTIPPALGKLKSLVFLWVLLNLPVFSLCMIRLCFGICFLSIALLN